MKLIELLVNIQHESRNFENIEIAGIEHDSRKIKSGFIYVCLKGLSFDGHDFAGAAYDAGASCLITEEFIEGIKCVQIKVEDSRKAYSLISSNWFGNPYKNLKIVAVTGTNGKTTTVNIIKTVLENAGIKAASMGTLGMFIGDKKYDMKLTTPDPMDFHGMLKIIEDSGCRYVIMETSAHALYLKKTEPVKFFAGVFTNLTQDHLDDFDTIEKYKNAKKLLFNDEKCQMAIINSDDDSAFDMVEGFSNEVVTYGTKKGAKLIGKDIECGFHDVKYVLETDGNEYDIKLNILGRFNVLNSLASIAVCMRIGLGMNEIIDGLDKVKIVDGRMESVNCGQDFMVIVDYAHSPDSLKSVLTAARGFTKNKVLSVFGCGGDRDRLKRPFMGEISDSLADFTIITSDNPRTEDPDSIIDMIEEGMVSDNYIRITDRSEAIRKSLETAQSGDVVVIAGKGHETYQDVMGKKHHFDDREIVREYFDEVKKWRN